MDTYIIIHHLLSEFLHLMRLSLSSYKRVTKAVILHKLGDLSARSLLSPNTLSFSSLLRWSWYYFLACIHKSL